MDRSEGTPREDRTVTASASFRWLRRGVVALLGLAVVAVLAGGLAWQLTGGRWQVIATPSMGEVAPVGSLVLTKPVTADQLAVGDVITYRPPNPAYRDTITHRVVEVEGSGAATTVRTRGDINGAMDAWKIGTPDLVGRVEAIGWGLGWLVKALPLLVFGGVLVYGATYLWAPTMWRVPLRVLGFSLLLSTATSILKPFVGVVSLGSSTDAGATQVLVVSTGVLPIRVAAESGGSVDLVDGQVGLITTQLPPGIRGATLTSGVHMSPWLWALMTLMWLMPLIYGIVAGRHDLAALAEADDAGGAGPDGGDDPDDAPTGPLPLYPSDVLGTDPDDDGEPVEAGTVGAGTARTSQRSRRPVLAAAVGLLMAAGLIVSTGITSAAFTARVTNSADTAATSPYFTCQAASETIGADYLNYPLDDANVAANATARDSSGQNRTGNYTTTAFSTTTNKPCPRDTTTRAVTITASSTQQGYVITPNTALRAGVFGLAIWFRTTSTNGGRLFGFGTSRTGASATNGTDRHLYMTNNGAVVFGVRPGSTNVIVNSAAGYNDGNWHLAVATQTTGATSSGAPAGMTLYIDGQQVAADPGATSTGITSGGYFRVGWDNLTGWPGRPTTDYYSGSLAFATLYGSGGVPGPADVSAYWLAGN